MIAEIRGTGIATLIVDRNARAVLAHTDRAVVLEKGVIVMAGESAALAGRGRGAGAAPRRLAPAARVAPPSPSS